MDSQSSKHNYLKLAMEVFIILSSALYIVIGVENLCQSVPILPTWLWSFGIAGIVSTVLKKAHIYMLPIRDRRIIHVIIIAFVGVVSVGKLAWFVAGHVFVSLVSIASLDRDCEEDLIQSTTPSRNFTVNNQIGQIRECKRPHCSTGQVGVNIPGCDMCEMPLYIACVVALSTNWLIYILSLCGLVNTIRRNKQQEKHATQK